MCGSSSFNPRLNVDMDAVNERLRSELGAAASKGVEEMLLFSAKDYEDCDKSISLTSIS